MITASDDVVPPSETSAAPERPVASGRTELREKRYRAYERVLAALSTESSRDESPMTSREMSYRQHAVVETLRDLELARRRYLLLNPEESDGPDAPAGG